MHRPREEARHTPARLLPALLLLGLLQVGTPAGAQETFTRMTGGGSVADGLRVRHGFELRCALADEPQRLQVNWGMGNDFHLEAVTSIACTRVTSPEILDVLNGSGTGRCNGATATARWQFTDSSEPGTSDSADLAIQGAAPGCDLEVAGMLKNGNHQSHRT